MSAFQARIFKLWGLAFSTGIMQLRLCSAVAYSNVTDFLISVSLSTTPDCLFLKLARCVTPDEHVRLHHTNFGREIIDESNG